MTNGSLMKVESIVEILQYFWPALKGTTTLMITTIYVKDLNKPRILMPVSSKSAEKCGSCGRLNIFKWTVMEAAIL